MCVPDPDLKFIFLAKFNLHNYSFVDFQFPWLRSKIQLSKFKDLTGSIQRFMNQAGSHLAYRKEFQGLCKMKDFYRQKGAGTRKLY